MSSRIYMFYWSSILDFDYIINLDHVLNDAAMDSHVPQKCMPQACKIYDLEHIPYLQFL